MSRRKGRAAKGVRIPKEELKQVWKEYVETRRESLRNRLVANYLHIVKLYAEKMKNSFPEKVEVEDLYQAGSVGLIEAVTRYDPKRNNTFETYCTHRIRGAILDHLRANDWVPRQVRSRAQRLNEVRTRLYVELGREPSENEYARELGLSLVEVRAWMDEAIDVHTQISLEAACADAEQDMLRLDLLADRSSPHPSYRLELSEIRGSLLNMLMPRERMVVELYYFQQVSMKEIGSMMGLSESRVCQIHKQAIEVLRSKLMEDMPRRIAN
ncbi:MAG: FliA/WhiG family RNA polymerase sigma factor [Planctomycetes bacterium]|nr:FliA/WhiG family RNA polymerase sigma factor [Planctomycetota bacterium]